ncbi:MAG: PAS domain S-box protein [bacterium]|nr:PAS domain S-box protein [bacterium]
MRTGFLARLGHLIVLQAIFVFAAIALVLFYPGPNKTSSEDAGPFHATVQDLGQRLLENYLQDPNLSDQRATGTLRDEIQLSGEGIVSAALFMVKGDGTVECLNALGPQMPTSSASDLTEGVSTIRQDLIRHVAAEAPGFFLSSIINDEQKNVYYRPLGSDIPAVLVATINHDLLISSRSELQYALIMLFLVSVLLSLMTIYLIWKRFRQPLVHLIRRLEKTADGEVYYQLETEGDIELNVLSNTFNRLTKTLWSNQQEMKSYNNRLREINASLLQSRLFLATLIDSSPSAIVVTSRDGQIIIFNREACKVFGYSSDDAVGRNVSELFKQPINKKLSDEDDKPGFEAISLRADGSAFPVWVTMTPTRSDEGDVWAFVYILHDITESTSFQEMMIRLDRYSTRGEMAGDIAHEINNYLAVLSGNLELLPIILKKGDPEKIEKKLELMRNTVDRVARFADGLMDTNRDEATPEPTSLNQVVENVLAFLKPQNKFDAVEFTTILSSELQVIAVDPGQVQQLLVNLVNNATDAAIAIGVKPDIRIATSCTLIEGNRYAQVSVADNGSGVPEEKVEALFTRRFTTKRKGHGIGLVTCKRIMDAHQGKIEYHFVDGAIFTCSFPYERTAVVEQEVSPVQPTSELVRA